MRRSIITSDLLIFLLTFSLQCYSQDFIDMEFLLSYGKEDISEYGIPASYDVDLYKVRYTSPDLKNEMDTLSGLLGIPDNKLYDHPLLLYAHGSANNREHVPSHLSEEHLIIAVFASLGYFSIAPDYLGLGDSKGIHPYVHADSEALACYNMIKAVRTSLDRNEFDINSQNFIFGYSQGGHAAMALQRFMELENPDGYEVTASAPSSGPYSISQEMKDFTIGENEYFFPGYLAYVTLSYHQVYGNIFSEGGFYSVFKPEYAVEMEKFKDEEIGLFELNDRLIDLLRVNHEMSVPKHMFLDEKLEEILNEPGSSFNVALLKNDVYDWSPQVPTRLFYCMNDEQVSYTNSIVAETAMNNNGAKDLSSLDVGSSLGHTECVPNAITMTYFFFDQYKQLIQGTYEPQINNVHVIYPNPTTNYILIHHKNKEYREGEATIMNMEGKILLQSACTTDQPISTRNLTAGQYILIWSTGESSEVHRLMIIG